MKPRSMTHILLSIGLMVVFSLAPMAVSSMGLQTPERGGGANADGYADLAIGIPYRDVGGFNNAGMVGFVPGRSIGLDYDNGAPFDFSTPGLFGEPRLNAHFGQALAGGDFNKDGYLDLAIGIPDESVNGAANAGVVSILFGSSSGYTGANSTYWIQPYLGTNIAEVSDRFGAALAAGDFNGDGYDDLAVGAPGQDNGSAESVGVVDVIYNAASGAETTDWSFVMQGQDGFQGVTEDGDNFGSVLATGDFDGDSYDDLAIGTPNEDVQVGPTLYVDAGVVQIVYGSPTGLVTAGNQLFYQGYNGLQDAPTNYDKFGYSLAAGHFDSGKYEDLAIGVPYEAGESGIVQIIWGDVSGLNAEIDMRINQGLISGESIEADDRFGWALAVGDFNGNGRDDLAIGVPGQDGTTYVGEGRVHALYGPFSSFATAFTKNNPSPEANANFGFALASGDIDGDGFDDLTASAPYQDESVTVTDSGALYTMMGSASGVVGSPVQYATLSYIGADGLAEVTGDRFGLVLLALDEPQTEMEFVYLPLVRK